MKEEKAKLILEGKEYNLPVLVGTENEKAVDISSLRSDSSYITLDNGFANTGSCTSAITFLDGEKSVLRYRGIPIEQLAEKSTFLETAYLLLEGELPTKDQFSEFRSIFPKHANIHNDMLDFFSRYPNKGHPMGILSAMVCSLSGYHPQLLKPEPTPEDIREKTALLLGKVRTIAAYAHKKSIDEEYIAPRDDLDYVSNFLYMMFSSSGKEYKIEKEVLNAMQTLLILHADHEQNCSTSAVRLVGSSWANMFASVSAGICALWGPLHGGANQKVIEMLLQIHEEGGNIEKFIAKAKDPDDDYRLMGFGHRVYKNYDPRATLIKKQTYEIFNKLGIHDPLLDIAVKLEEAVLKDDYFIERKLYANVDFYSGLVYKAIGINPIMFPVLFAVGRMPGWIANWKEMRENPKSRICRPRQIYVGLNERDYIPIDQR